MTTECFFEQSERASTYSWVYNFDDSVYIKRTSNENFLCYFLPDLVGVDKEKHC